MRKCEHINEKGETACLAYGNFIVGIGTRKTDRQRSCGRHLSATVAERGTDKLDLLFNDQETRTLA